MPIYEYRCESCAGTFEVLTTYAERERAFACPSCESMKTRVLVSSFARTAGETSAPIQLGGPPAGGGGCCGGGCGCGAS